MLVKDIRVRRRNPTAHVTGTQDRPVTPPTTPARIGWLRLDMTTLGSAFALTLIAGMYAYLANMPLGVPELFFLLAGVLRGGARGEVAVGPSPECKRGRT